jgi:hypothetical protein
MSRVRRHVTSESAFALAPVVTLVDERVRAIVREEIQSVARSQRAAYSQRDHERPVGASRVRFLRVWRVAHAARDTGAWAEGRARIMTADAWERWASASGQRPRPELRAPAPKADPDTELLVELGARRVEGRGK